MGVWIVYVALLGALLLFGYVSARFRYRIPYLFVCIIVGYVWGRIAYFCAIQGAVGVVSMILGELLCFAFCFVVSLLYYAHLGDALLCSLRPRFNRGVVSFGLRCLLWGSILLFVYCAIVGLIALFVGLPSA